MLVGGREEGMEGGKGVDDCKCICVFFNAQNLDSFLPHTTRTSQQSFSSPPSLPPSLSLSSSISPSPSSSPSFPPGMTDRERTAVLAAWSAGQLRVICATIAFGVYEKQHTFFSSRPPSLHVTIHQMFSHFSEPPLLPSLPSSPVFRHGHRQEGRPLRHPHHSRQVAGGLLPRSRKGRAGWPAGTLHPVLSQGRRG